MNVYTKQKQTHRHKKQTCGYGWGGQITDYGYGIDRYRLLHIKYISNKDLLHSTGNYIQYLVITHNVI